MSRDPITETGAKLLRDELKRLKNVDRPRIIKDIATAREHGDLKENAEYHAAREQQSFAEGRIAEIESKLSNAQIIDITKLDVGDKIVFGATVTVFDVEADNEVTYQIVGDDESDIESGKISINSPIARGLLGKHVDDVAVIQAPGGERELEVVNVKYV